MKLLFTTLGLLFSLLFNSITLKLVKWVNRLIEPKSKTCKGMPFDIGNYTITPLDKQHYKIAEINPEMYFNCVRNNGQAKEEDLNAEIEYHREQSIFNELKGFCE